jgi:hypothetical protein
MPVRGRISCPCLIHPALPVLPAGRFVLEATRMFPSTPAKRSPSIVALAGRFSCPDDGPDITFVSFPDALCGGPAPVELCRLRRERLAHL